MFLSLFLIMLNSNNPLIIGSLVILQCCFTSLIINQLFLIRWFRFLIFMIYLGGILILFSYIIRLTYSKEPIIKQKKRHLFIVFVYLFFSIYPRERISEFNNIKIDEILASLYRKNILINIFIIYFLLLVMLIVIFIVETNKSSIRRI